MAEIDDLVVTDDSNTARWPEGMAPAAVNNAARAMEGYLARWFKDTNGTITASGSSNAYAITSNRTLASLTNNQVLAWTANHSNSGASTLNLNGLGAVAIKRPNGDALISGDIVSGQAVVTIYKSSTGFWYLLSPPGAVLPASDSQAGGIEIAVQSEMEAASSTTLAVAPGRQHYHPLHAKGMLIYNISADTIILSEGNVSSVTKNGTGDFTVTFSPAFATTDYGAVGWARSNGTGRRAGVSANSNDAKTASTMRFRVDVFDSSSAPIDSAEVTLMFFGALT